ncbi:PREDICTED: protein GAMETE EXPRESSED 2-like, partial [Camelina sativa]|uniref:Protein GAMETE EXPRESSED 2-like n=1 Tax=Camelina sativa TaxID=90675 RepID=A0ABM0Y8U4_CAMSA
MSFTLFEPGNFLLTLSDMKQHNKSISGMPYAYTVYIGYCDGSRSIVNGSGINASIAGASLGFSIYLKDAYGYPSSVQVDRLQVRILLEADSSFILPTIHPRETLNGTGSSSQTATPLYEKHGRRGSGSLATQASIFDVTYTPKRSGIYKILISSGNIVLHGGQPFVKEVYAGEINVAACSVTQFNGK